MPSSVCLSGPYCADGADIPVELVRLGRLMGFGEKVEWGSSAEDDPWPVLSCPTPCLPVFLSSRLPVRPSARLPVRPSSRPQRGREICCSGENFPPSGVDLRKVPPSRMQSRGPYVTRRAVGARTRVPRASLRVCRNSAPGLTTLTHIRRTGPVATRYSRSH